MRWLARLIGVLGFFVGALLLATPKPVAAAYSTYDAVAPSDTCSVTIYEQAAHAYDDPSPVARDDSESVDWRGSLTSLAAMSLTVSVSHDRVGAAAERSDTGTCSFGPETLGPIERVPLPLAENGVRVRSPAAAQPDVEVLEIEAID